jgi:hypothetical protein
VCLSFWFFAFLSVYHLNDQFFFKNYL